MRGVVQVVGGDQPGQLRVIIRGPVDAVLVIAEKDDPLGLVLLALDGDHVSVVRSQRPAQDVERIVGGLDVGGVAPALESASTRIPARQARHVGMVAKVHNHVGLLVDYVLADPFQVNGGHAGLGLRVRDH